MPYAQSALQDVLHQATIGYASRDTADSMAKAAYQQAAQLSKLGSRIIGIGCTCALMTDRVKKGDHKACFSPAAFAIACMHTLLAFPCYMLANVLASAAKEAQP